MLKLQNHQRGSAFLMVMCMALPMFLAVGLVVDIGWAYYTRQAAHAAAEAAAMAAAQSALDGIKAGGTYTCGSQGLGCYTSTAYTCPSTTPNPITSNVQNGCAYAAANGFTNGGPNGQAVTMLANTSSPLNGVSVKYWMTAQILQQSPLTFGGVLGGRFMNVGAHATAAVFLSVPPNCVIALDPSAHLQPGAGGEHGPLCRHYGRKRLEAQWRKFGVVISGFQTSAHEIGLVPEASATGIAQELLPPAAMRFGASPTFHGLEILPIPAHSHMKGKQAI